MQEKTLLKIAGRIRPLSPAATVTQMAFEEGDGFYDAWKITDEQTACLLKVACENELGIYRRLNNRIGVLPRFLGDTGYYGKRYMLLKYVEGHDLMRCDRKDLVRVLDAMIELQDAFWNTKKRIGHSMSHTLPRLRRRRACLPETELRTAYDRFLAVYPTLPRTLCHDDLLPFNLIVNDRRAVFIDWEEAGILPYPAMLVRLLAHGSEHGETPFFMTGSDKAFAVDYYYEHLPRSKGISREEYDRSLSLFWFYELTEWIYVYRKYHKKPDALYQYYLAQAQNAAKEIAF